jgi:hypothetical protein
MLGLLKRESGGVLAFDSFGNKVQKRKAYFHASFSEKEL